MYNSLCRMGYPKCTSLYIVFRDYFNYPFSLDLPLLFRNQNGADGTSKETWHIHVMLLRDPVEVVSSWSKSSSVQSSVTSSEVGIVHLLFV